VTRWLALPLLLLAALAYGQVENIHPGGGGTPIEGLPMRMLFGGTGSTDSAFTSGDCVETFTDVDGYQKMRSAGDPCGTGSGSSTFSCPTPGYALVAVTSGSPTCVLLATPDGNTTPGLTATPVPSFTPPGDCGAGFACRQLTGGTPVCVAIPTPDGTPNPGDVTAVGPGCATGACLTNGVASSGATLFLWEGTTVDGNDLAINAPADPGSSATVTFPLTNGTLITTGDSGTVAGGMIANDTIALGTKTTGNYVASVAESTALDCSGTGEGAAVSCGLDTTEVETVTWGTAASAPHVWTVDTGTGDPILEFDDDTVDISSASGAGQVIVGIDGVTNAARFTASGDLDAGGNVNLTGATGTVIFEGSSADANETILAVTNPTADRTVTFQNASGTVAYLTDITGATAGTYIDVAGGAVSFDPTEIGGQGSVVSWGTAGDAPVTWIWDTGSDAPQVTVDEGSVDWDDPGSDLIFSVSGSITADSVLSPNVTVTTLLALDTGATLAFEGSGADAFETTLTVTNPTADRTVTFPDASGTACLSGQTCTITVSGTATALAADGANCSAGSYPLGVDQNGAVQGCTVPTFTVQEGDVTVNSGIGTLDFAATSFDLSESPSGEINVALAANVMTTSTAVSTSQLPTIFKNDDQQFCLGTDTDTCWQFASATAMVVVSGQPFAALQIQATPTATSTSAATPTPTATVTPTPTATAAATATITGSTATPTPTTLPTPYARAGAQALTGCWREGAATALSGTVYIGSGTGSATAAQAMIWYPFDVQVDAMECFYDADIAWGKEVDAVFEVASQSACTGSAEAGLASCTWTIRADGPRCTLHGGSGPKDVWCKKGWPGATVQETPLFLPAGTLHHLRTSVTSGVTFSIPTCYWRVCQVSGPP
jgi:cell division septation protein DedD